MKAKSAAMATGRAKVAPKFAVMATVLVRMPRAMASADPMFAALTLLGRMRLAMETADLIRTVPANADLMRPAMAKPAGRFPVASRPK